MPCHKASFVSRSDALAAVRKASGIKLRPYQCPMCKLYHLTSKSSRQMRAARKRARQLSRMSREEVIAARQKIEEEKDQEYRDHFEEATRSKT